ncbi:hypothetical protein GALMADRAFT_228328 [Galerina marginata CBS 339.88]|uniref:Glycosyltransferase family 8 protein n=1 Tax=Galerina marginata (strain CBS 339.88) TaxID=685588 RepID=A0A067SZV0_GALM3|nr:hypothetical protein GALMADRAFT_228328 [Galerina marginata CBS 339.88]
MTSYQFTSTQDWFSHNIENWTKLFPLVQSKEPRVLEIGSWEGRSAVFLLNNLCKDGGEIFCIDHFDLFNTEVGQQRFERINHNLALTGKKSRILPQFSVPALMNILEAETTSDNPGFDWIYVDGSYEADDTMLDGELVWRVAKKGAIVIFDDYHWDKEPENSIHHPKRGIDAFLTLHAGEYERLTGEGHYQVVLRKLTDMRIGFLVGRTPDRGLEKALGYGINIVLTIDSSYIIGATVTIQSLLENTPGRMTIYVVDCGLLPEDKHRLGQAVDAHDEASLVFLQLPEDSLAAQLGPTWAKLDMIEILPVERVLYLDADTLVRRNLKELWDIDLESKCVGAAIDIGHPMGHDEMKRGPYFNAGVLLLDLAKARLDINGLTALGKRMKDAKFRDQDTLNVHFASNWANIDLTWNAQGLGTYANYPSSDRDKLGLQSMAANPHIVHFTGPVHPSLIEVLNPYVQPPTAKPWGYLSSPGHPYQAEWWKVLERTTWKGLRSTEIWATMNKREVEKAVEVATHRFQAFVATESFVVQ